MKILTDYMIFLGPCLPGSYYILNQLKCELCDIGKYQPSAGSFQCNDCEFLIKYTPTTGSTSQEDCRSK